MKFLYGLALGCILAFSGVLLWHKIHPPIDPVERVTLPSAYFGGRHQPTPGKTVAVVFVHGIFGDDSSWASASNSLPAILTTDPVLSPQAEAFLFEYKSPKLRSAESISVIAANLKEDLITNQVWSGHKTVIFMAHSMGGIIARQELMLDLTHLPQVAGMVFYAVPTDGAAITKLAGQISKNPQLTDLCRWKIMIICRA